ncbi:MAG: asparagine synthase (glutamine-hydrolyzing) [Planctomycetota bacterium]
MCGIAGLFRLDGAPVAPETLLAMARVLAHRGPDEEGYFVNRDRVAEWPDGAPLRHLPAGGAGHVGLGHRRLSIIDLKSGQQPLSNEDGTVWISFNGEIYNFQELQGELEARGHRFRTRSDTETIVHAYEEWGEGSVARLRGMFAFAIWDEKAQRMLLARDRLGKKPLYYAHDGRRFLFGSEIKAILRFPGVSREVDVAALSDYLSLLYVPAPRSIFAQVRKLPAAHYAVVKREGMRIAPYWDLPFAPVARRPAEAEEARLLEILSEATRMRMISEVPLGAFLSGGVDSSAVVAFMAEHSPRPVLTSSISFSVAAYDESRYARRVADLFRTDHRVHTVTPEAIPIVEKLAWHYDEPFADSSAVPTYYVSRTAREHVTVALSGDGGDENFAGYRRYAFDRRENLVRNLVPRPLRRLVFGGIGKLYPKADWLPQVFRGKTFLSNVARDPVEAYFFTMSAFKEEQKAALLLPEVARLIAGHRTSDLFRDHYGRAQAEDHLSRIQYLDVKTYLCDDILTKVDRASMAVSLEVRCPILDHVLMEYVATIPSERKLKGGDKKRVLRSALRSRLPAEILDRPKMGFGVPILEWLRGDLSDYARELVLDGEGTRAYLQRPFLDRMWRQHQSGARNFATELWTVMMFNLWHRRFVEDPGAPAAGARVQPAIPAARNGALERGAAGSDR